MATFKHISSKNADYGAAEQYLAFEHDEFTMRPTLDADGRLVPREDYRLAALNCGGEDFAVACMRSNLRYGKNQKREDVKSHHYIISFDPRDGPDNSLTVTLFFVDHSAYDAYMFLIEERSTGLRVLHTGDFRGHGFRGGKLIPMLKRYVGQVDWLICEGTMLSRGAETVRTEHQLQREFRGWLKEYRKVFVLCSSMNIDRIAGFVHALDDPKKPGRRTDGRVIVCDMFQRSILDIVQRHGAEHTALYDFSEVLWHSDRVDALMEKRGFLCFIRANRYFENLLERHGKGALIVYSMWDGYIKDGPAKNDGYVTAGGERLAVPAHKRPRNFGETFRGSPYCSSPPGRNPHPHGGPGKIP